MRLSCTAFLLLCSSYIFSQANLNDSLQMEAFLDGLIEAHLKDKHIAGATLSVVRDSQLLFAKGYGWADKKNKIKVDPERTLFRIGSISKMFVWTSIMQLYAEGKVDLDADINQYFEAFQVPEAFDQPITLKHLMTHTPGFEDYIIGLFSDDPAKVKALDEILKKEMPARVRPPGKHASYSNHGTGMAAHIVERASGLEWNAYVEKNIFEVLGMENTTFRQPLPEALAGDMSKGYFFSGGEFQEKDFEYVPLAPVGAVSSTATDMAKFMIAHLQLGSFENAVVLDSTTASTMQNTIVFQHAPNTNPMRYGFMDVSQNGQKIIGHGGDTFWFHSLMALFPEHQIGIFLSFNSQGGGGTYLDVLEAFVDRYFPEEVKPSDISLDKATLEAFEGQYRANRYPHKRFTKIAAAMGSTKITATDEGKIKLWDGATVTYYVPIDSMTFREEDTSNTIAFERDENGEISHFFYGSISIMAMERIPVLESPGLQSSLLIFVLGVMVFTLLVWPLIYFLRRKYRLNPQIQLPPEYKWIAASAIIIYALIPLFLFGSDPTKIALGMTFGIKFGLFLTIVFALITLLVFYFMIKTLRNKRINGAGKFHYFLLSLAFLLATLQLYQWNLLGFNF